MSIYDTTRAYHTALRHAVETGDLLDLAAVLAHYGVQLVQDTDSGARVTDRALERHVADALAHDLRHGAGVEEVSVAADCDDPSVAWVYATTS